MFEGGPKILQCDRGGFLDLVLSNVRCSTKHVENVSAFQFNNHLSVVVKHLRPSRYFWHIEYDGGLPHNLGPRASHPLKRALTKS